MEHLRFRNLNPLGGRQDRRSGPSFPLPKPRRSPNSWPLRCTLLGLEGVRAAAPPRTTATTAVRDHEVDASSVRVREGHAAEDTVLLPRSTCVRRVHRGQASTASTSRVAGSPPKPAAPCARWSTGSHPSAPGWRRWTTSALRMHGSSTMQLTWCQQRWNPDSAAAAENVPPCWLLMFSQSSSAMKSSVPRWVAVSRFSERW